jgi:L-ascorbate metabolism protein UlaG (beta-lactamase superfamily)
MKSRCNLYRCQLLRPLLASAVLAYLVPATGEVSAQAPASTRARTRPAVVDDRAKQGDPGCQQANLVSTGGAPPGDPHRLAIRWIGYSNFELVYNGQIILLDAYYDRGAAYPPLGMKAGDIRKADVLLIGHGHFDHMSDAASIAARTKAVVVGAPLTTEKLVAQGLERAQLRAVTGRGGAALRFGDTIVEPILARHGEPPPNVTAAFSTALRSVTPAATADQAAEQAAIRQRGVSDPRVTSEGTIAYLITFNSGVDGGFKVMYRDSGGRITDEERAAMARVGRVDVALVAVAADYLNTLTAQRALEHVHTYKPDVFIPAHHDAALNELWRPTEPIFQALKDDDPALTTISRGYREPICFDTGGRR